MDDIIQNITREIYKDVWDDFKRICVSLAIPSMI